MSPEFLPSEPLPWEPSLWNTDGVDRSSSLVPFSAFFLSLSPLLLDLLLLVLEGSVAPLYLSEEFVEWEPNLSKTEGGLRLPLLDLPSRFLSEFPESLPALPFLLPSLSNTEIES